MMRHLTDCETNSHLFLIKYRVVIFEEVEAHDVEVESGHCQEGVVAIVLFRIPENVVVNGDEVTLASNNKADVREYD